MDASVDSKDTWLEEKEMTLLVNCTFDDLTLEFCIGQMTFHYQDIILKGGDTFSDSTDTHFAYKKPYSSCTLFI